MGDDMRFSPVMIALAATSLMIGCASGTATSSNSSETAANADNASVAAPSTAADVIKRISGDCKSPIVQMVTKQDGTHHYLLGDATLWQADDNGDVKFIKKLEDTSEVTMIGDSYIADVEGAINAGIKAILVRKENIHNYQNYCKSLDEIDAILL